VPLLHYVSLITICVSNKDHTHTFMLNDVAFISVFTVVDLSTVNGIIHTPNSESITNVASDISPRRLVRQKNSIYAGGNGNRELVHQIDG